MKRQHHEMEQEEDNHSEPKDNSEEAPLKYVNMPKKNKHRMHAHINPFNSLTFACPRNPRFADWSIHYPSYYNIPNNNGNKIFVNTGKYQVNYDKEATAMPVDKEHAVPTILDIGCGYGGLMFELNKHFQ